MTRFGLTANRRWFATRLGLLDPASQRGRIYNYIADHPGATTATVADALGLQQLESRLSEMERAGHLRSEYAADLFS